MTEHIKLRITKVKPPPGSKRHYKVEAFYTACSSATPHFQLAETLRPVLDWWEDQIWEYKGDDSSSSAICEYETYSIIDYKRGGSMMPARYSQAWRWSADVWRDEDVVPFTLRWDCEMVGF